MSGSLSGASLAACWRLSPSNPSRVTQTVPYPTLGGSTGLGRKEEAHVGRRVGTLAVLGWLLYSPTTPCAQATIAGTARDASGSVLSGVAVEAASPVPIEKIRTTVNWEDAELQMTWQAKPRNKCAGAWDQNLYCR